MGNGTERLEEQEAMGNYSQTVYSRHNKVWNHRGCDMSKTYTRTRWIKSQHVLGGGHRTVYFLRCCRWFVTAKRGSQFFRSFNLDNLLLFTLEPHHCPFTTKHFSLLRDMSLPPLLWHINSLPVALLSLRADKTAELGEGGSKDRQLLWITTAPVVWDL